MAYQNEVCDTCKHLDFDHSNALRFEGFYPQPYCRLTDENIDWPEDRAACKKWKGQKTFTLEGAGYRVTLSRKRG